MRSFTCMLVLLAATMLLAGCPSADNPARPMPGVSLDPNPPKDEWAGRDEVAEAAVPYLVRTPEETLQSSLESARSLAERAGRYADIQDKCQTLDASSVKESAELKLGGRQLYVLHAEDHRHATRLRLLRPDGTAISCVREDTDSAALDIIVKGGEGVKGKVIVTTKPDPGDILPDTAPLSIGQLILYVSR